MGWWKFAGLLALTVLPGCHTRAPDAREGVVGGLREGALAPLEDLNVRREEIPSILSDLDVYDKPVPSTCTGIEIEIADLEAYVGSDIDRVVQPEAQTSLRGRVEDLADDQAYKLVSDLTTDFIPFRSMVRRATGASAHDKAVREAYRRGRLRRSYLKGVGFAMGCDSPAAPRFPQTIAERKRLDEEAAAVSFEVLEVPPAW
jgi:hypothetical protein